MPAAAATVCYTRRANTHNAGQRFGIFVLIHIYFMPYIAVINSKTSLLRTNSKHDCIVTPLHVFLQGLYAMSMNCMDAAEAQFKTALQVVKPLFASNVVCRLKNVCPQ